MKNIAELKNVSLKYGKQTALNDISVKLPAGKIIGVIGPDGVGKSSLLALLAGVRELQSGEANVLDGDIRQNRHLVYCRQHIAYMPQGLGRNLYPTLSVEENLNFFAGLFSLTEKQKQERIRILLNATQLSPFKDRPAGKLSGGMKQKLGLCCALIHQPEFLILDEPTTGVDPLSRRQFWELINRIRESSPQMSVIVATAYMQEAEEFDWLIALNSGKVLAQGTPEQIKSSTGKDNLDSAFTHLLPEDSEEIDFNAYQNQISDHSESVIQASHLTLKFGDFTAVNDVSFDIKKGEIFGFLGSNGCGKTTTMKMLTGLLPPTEGDILLLGETPDTGNLSQRTHIGYMSQSFSLYEELTVKNNLIMHAQLFELDKDNATKRIQYLCKTLDLDTVMDQKPGQLSLGVKQRLQLAVAVLHDPEILILDEPTSGVDPIARDKFWVYLLKLAREQGVTIFISTHFMDEAERCDRISLMHRGKVLDVGTPTELTNKQGSKTLENAFIRYLEKEIKPSSQDNQDEKIIGFEKAKKSKRFSLKRLWAITQRETTELIRDPIRLVFALVGPLILMVAFGYGISFDVDHLKVSIWDEDRSLESRLLIENVEQSKYFDRIEDSHSEEDVLRYLKSSQARIILHIPEQFGKKLLRQQTPEVAIYIDGAIPFRAETTLSYMQGIALTYAEELLRQSPLPQSHVRSIDMPIRFHYNQSFNSVNATVPGIIMLMLALIPVMMTAVGIVKEKEYGSISNFHSTPITGLEYLLGKQAPYIVVSYISFLLMSLIAWTVFNITPNGSYLALNFGVILYVMSTTAFGLLLSSFLKTQVAAMFASAVITLVPALNLSGLLTPISSLDPSGRLIGTLFPAAWFQKISLANFIKSLDFSEQWLNHLTLFAFFITFMALAILLLKKQEA